MEVSERFWNAPLEELKRGYSLDNECYICLLCGKSFELGIVYSDEGTLYEAERYMRLHIGKVHGSVFEYLSGLDKKLTGLTDHQSGLLRLFYEGKSDDEVRTEMGIGSVSTIRNHRFVLKEKERQSKLFLAMMELLKEKDKHAPAFVSLPRTAKLVDDPYNVTEEERQQILRKYFPEGTNGPLKTFTVKEKQRFVVLTEIAGRFDSERLYNEKEVNAVLAPVYHDYVTVRRFLIEYGFLDRKPDGSEYWLKNKQRMKEWTPMNRRAELVQQYKEMKTEAGIYRIRNTVNGKALVESTRNLKSINGKRMTLQMGSHINKSLQEDWNLFGEDAFVIEVLETLKKKEEGYFDEKDALKKLEREWLDRLQPYGDRGYNKRKPEQHGSDLGENC